MSPNAVHPIDAHQRAARTIRPLVIADIEPLQELDHIAHGDAWSERTFRDEFEQDGRIHLVAECDGSAIAHAASWIDGPSCRITNVAVAADHAGQGHASALLVALLRASLAHNVVSNMQLEVRPANRRAQRLYSRFGFTPVGVERDFYDRSDASGSRDAVVMTVADVCDETWRNRLDELESTTGSGAVV